MRGIVVVRRADIPMRVAPSRSDTMRVMSATLAGLSSGASFSLALALAPLRTTTPAATVRLSGMAQSFGYLIAAAGPVVAGWLAAATSWAVVVAAIVVLALVQAGLGYLAGERRHLEDGLPVG